MQRRKFSRELRQGFEGRGIVAGPFTTALIFSFSARATLPSLPSSAHKETASFCMQYDQCRLLSYKDFFACSTQLFVQLCDSDGLLESN